MHHVTLVCLLFFFSPLQVGNTHKCKPLDRKVDYWTEVILLFFSLPAPARSTFKMFLVFFAQFCFARFSWPHAAAFVCLQDISVWTTERASSPPPSRWTMKMWPATSWGCRPTRCWLSCPTCASLRKVRAMRPGMCFTYGAEITSHIISVYFLL